MPNARRLRAPRGRGGWASGFSEYAIDGEANRFRYVCAQWKTKDGTGARVPGTGSRGERRIFAIVGAEPGVSPGAIALFEELTNRPLSDNRTRL